MKVLQRRIRGVGRNRGILGRAGDIIFYFSCCFVVAMAEKMKNLTRVPMAKIGPLALVGLGLGAAWYFGQNAYYVGSLWFPLWSSLKLTFFVVEGGHRAIVYSRISGIKPTVYGEGFKFKIPWLEREVIYNARAVSRKIRAYTGSKGTIETIIQWTNKLIKPLDLQMIDITINVLSKPNVDQLPDMYRQLGVDYAERVLPSVATEVVKSVVVRFSLFLLRSLYSLSIGSIYCLWIDH